MGTKIIGGVTKIIVMVTKIIGGLTNIIVMVTNIFGGITNIIVMVTKIIGGIENGIGTVMETKGTVSIMILDVFGKLFRSMKNNPVKVSQPLLFLLFIW